MENSGEGKTYRQTPPQNRFWTPPTYDTLTPPPLYSSLVIFIRGNGHRPDESHFLRPPQLVLEGAFYSTFPHPQIARYVLPLCNFPSLPFCFLSSSREVSRALKAGHVKARQSDGNCWGASSNAHSALQNKGLQAPASELLGNAAESLGQKMAQDRTCG